MKEDYIGVFDSGIGGLTILDELQKLMPNEKFIYYADSLNNPYGDKTDEQLFEITENIVDYFKRKRVKLVTIACNTATTRCICHLREKYPDIIFVGTEPAIKVACDNNYKNILVMVTPGTYKTNRVKKLIEDNKKEYQNIYLLSCDNLANLIETKNDIEIDKLLKKLFSSYLDKNIDAVVLGCTHYPHIKNKIGKYFNNASFIDGSEGVSKQVKRLLENQDLLNDTKKEIIYYNSLNK